MLRSFGRESRPFWTWPRSRRSQQSGEWADSSTLPPTHMTRRAYYGGTRRLFERLSRPLHRKLDVLGLKLAPAFDLGLIPVLRVFFEVSLASFRANDCSLVNFSRMKGSFVFSRPRTGIDSRAFKAIGQC